MLDMEAVEAFRKHAMNPDNPEAVAFCEPAEVYMQHKESLNRFYDKVPETAEKYMQMIHEITGREYHLFNYSGAPMRNTLLSPSVPVLRPLKKRFNDSLCCI